MSKFTSVVAGVVGSDQLGSIYGCTDDTIKIRRYAYDGSHMSMDISTGSGSLESNRGVAVAVQPPDLTGASPTHVFVSREGNHHTCHVVDPGGTDDVDINLEEADFGFASAFGAAATPNGVVLVGFDPTQGGDQKLRWAFCTWESLTAGQFSQTTYRTIDMSSLVGSRIHDSHCEVRLAVIRDATGGLRVVLGTTWKGSSHYHLMGFQALLDDDGMPATGLSTTTLDYSITSTEELYENLQLQQSPAGPLFLSVASNVGALVWSCPIDDRVGTWSGPHLLVEEGFSRPAGVAYVPLWIPGPLMVATSSANARLEDCTMPLRAATLEVSGSSFTAALSTNPVGSLRRRALSCQREQGDRVLGIIAGPPPVPIENLNMPLCYDTFSGTGAPAIGSTSWSLGESNSDELEVTWGVGVGGSYTTKVEEEQKIEVYGVQFGEESAYAQFQVSLQMKYQGAYTTVTKRTSVRTVDCSLEMSGTGPSQDGQGHYQVTPAGVVVTAGVTWTGYTYEFIDPDGEVPQNSLSFTTLFPSEVQHDLQTFGMANSTFGNPGDLQSYYLTPSELDGMNDVAVPIGTDDDDYLEFSVTTGGSMHSSFESYSENSWINGFELDLETSLGAGGSAALLGVGVSQDVTVSGSLTFGVKSTQSSDETVGLQSELQVRGSSEAPGVYRSYSWRVYQLAGSAQWLDELRNTLENANSATSSQMLADNQSLLASLTLDSKPWLIRYAVTNFAQNGV